MLSGNLDERKAIMILEEVPVVIDERSMHPTPLPESVLKNHADAATQRRIAVHKLNQIKLLMSPNGKRAVSAE